MVIRPSNLFSLGAPSNQLSQPFVAVSADSELESRLEIGYLIACESLFFLVFFL
jgi:hypothetical protein